MSSLLSGINYANIHSDMQDIKRLFAIKPCELSASVHKRNFIIGADNRLLGAFSALKKKPFIIYF